MSSSRTPAGWLKRQFHLSLAVFMALQLFPVTLLILRPLFPIVVLAFVVVVFLRVAVPYLVRRRGYW